MSTITQATVSSANEILAVLKANGGLIIDDHDRNGKPFKASHVARFTNDGEEHIVQVYPNVPFSINPVTLDEDGEPHLRKWSIGGTVRPDVHGSLDEAVAAYNRGKFGTITEVIAL